MMETTRKRRRKKQELLCTRPNNPSISYSDSASSPFFFLFFPIPILIIFFSFISSIQLILHHLDYRSDSEQSRGSTHKREEGRRELLCSLLLPLNLLDSLSSSLINSMEASSGVMFRQPATCAFYSSKSRHDHHHHPSRRGVSMFRKSSYGISCSEDYEQHSSYYHYYNRQPSPPRVAAADAVTAAAESLSSSKKKQKKMIPKQEGDEKKAKKKFKSLLKGLTKDLSLLLSHHHHPTSLDQLHADGIPEATQALLDQLQRLRAEKKESKRRKKQVKGQLSPASDNWEVSSSSSESSSGSSGDEVQVVKDLSRLRRTRRASLLGQATEQTTPTELLSYSQSVLEVSLSPSLRGDSCTTSSSFTSSGVAATLSVEPKRIEVCMGNKCKKSGAAVLLEEMDKRIGVEGAVVGCKCMGKCRNGPNIRVPITCNDGDAAGAPSKLRSSLCIGVGLDDVGAVVANFFGHDQNVAPSYATP